MTDSTQPIPSFRVGMGYDVHKLVEGRNLYLGGIKIEHTLGLLGHSDADVLIHAICDALLGAANMRYGMCRASKDKPTYPCYVRMSGRDYRL